MQVSRQSSFLSPSMRARPAGGFTLIELAVTVVVLSVMMAMAAPLFTGMTNGNRLTSNANEIVAAMQIARSEAVRRNTRTSFCESSNGTSCTNGSPWRGWLVFADADNDTIVDADEIVRAGVIEAPIRVAASPNITNNTVVFRADGMGYEGNDLLEANMRVCLPVTNPQFNVRDVNIAIGGRINVRAPINAAGACPAPGDL